MGPGRVRRMRIFKNGRFYHYEFVLHGRRRRGSTGTDSKPQGHRGGAPPAPALGEKLRPGHRRGSPRTGSGKAACHSLRPFRKLKSGYWKRQLLPATKPDGRLLNGVPRQPARGRIRRPNQHAPSTFRGCRKCVPLKVERKLYSATAGIPSASDIVRQIKVKFPAARSTLQHNRKTAAAAPTAE